MEGSSPGFANAFMQFIHFLDGERIFAVAKFRSYDFTHVSSEFSSYGYINHCWEKTHTGSTGAIAGIGLVNEKTINGSIEYPFAKALGIHADLSNIEAG